MDKRKGFTLVELLVVIAIIAILMAILIPALNRARKMAKMSICMSNLHQWSIACTLYMDDNDGLFSQDELNADGFWQCVLRPYYADIGDLRCCPMALKPAVPSGGGGGASGSTFIAWGVFSASALQWAEDGDYGSYGLNGWLYSGRPFVGNEEDYWKGYNNVPSPSNVPLILDCVWIDGWPFADNGPYMGDNHLEQGYGGRSFLGRFCINRHNGFVNGAFMDASVRKIGVKELWKLKWHRKFDTAGPYTLAGGVTPDDWPDWMQSFTDY